MQLYVYECFKCSEIYLNKDDQKRIQFWEHYHLEDLKEKSCKKKRTGMHTQPYTAMVANMPCREQNGVQFLWNTSSNK